MPLVRIDGRDMNDFESFHDLFGEAFGFPDFHSRNLDVWIDCMTHLDDPDARMTSVHGIYEVVLRCDRPPPVARRRQ